MNFIARTGASWSPTGRASGAPPSWDAPAPDERAPALRMEDSTDENEDFVSTLPSDLFDEEDVDIVLNVEATSSRTPGPVRFDAVVAWSHAQAGSRRVEEAARASAVASAHAPAAASASAFVTSSATALPAVPAAPEIRATEPGAWTDSAAPRLRFTGTGSEYFRLWVIHLLLCVATVGLYAPWAQRRDLQWWARHTSLDGDPFNFHGAPHRMLAHRLMGLVLVVGVWLSLLQPLWTGAAMLGVMMLGAAALSMRIRRFRLHHLSWRGMRLGQRLGAAPRAVAVLPPVLTARSRLRLAGAGATRRGGQAPATQLLLSRGWLLLPTMGLYWPFLAVHLARLRVEAMAVRADELRTALDTPALARADATGQSGRALGLA